MSCGSCNGGRMNPVMRILMNLLREMSNGSCGGGNYNNSGGRGNGSGNTFVLAFNQDNNGFSG